MEFVIKHDRKKQIEGIVEEFRTILRYVDKTTLSNERIHTLNGYCEQLLIIADEIEEQKSLNCWFNVKDPSEWGKIFNIEVLDPDGWRDTSTLLTKKIDAAEFLTLAKRSTIAKWKNKKK